jgi:hypothetical protein
MGRIATPAIIEPTVGIDDVQVMSGKAALAALVEFCDTNGFPRRVQTDAFDLFRRAALAPGHPIRVPTTQGQSHTIAVHNCMQAITDNQVAGALAGVAFDAEPGTRFDHRMKDNACELVNECTNAR